MANAVEKKTKDGKRFYELRAYSKEKGRYYTSRWYVPEGWGSRSIQNELKTQLVNFQNAVNAGEILSKKEQAAKAEAERAAAEKAAAELAKLKTVKQYANSVFMPDKERSISENTRLSYRSNLDKHILPKLGATLMQDVTPAMINALLFDFQKDHSYGSTVKLYNVLHGLFESALFDDTIQITPMMKVKRPKQKKDERAVAEADKALFADELLHVLDCLKNEPLKWRCYIELMADTGMRRGECCAVQWSDFDFKAGTVTIKRNLQYSTDKGVYEAAPKGGRFRTVDIGPDVIALLKAYQQEQASKRLSKWVFTQEGEDEPMFPHAPTRYFQKFGERYNIPGFHPHLLRHTSATLSLTNGGDPKSVADRLGHADAAVLLRVYAHASDESIRNAGQAARDALKLKKEKAKAEA